MNSNLLFTALTQIASQVENIKEALQKFLDTIDATSESERWKVAGDALLDDAKNTQLNDNDASLHMVLECRDFHIKISGIVVSAEVASTHLRRIPSDENPLSICAQDFPRTFHSSPGAKYFLDEADVPLPLKPGPRSENPCVGS